MLLAVAAGALLAQCQPAPTSTPPPTTTTSPPPCPERGKERWGMLVLYEKDDGACTSFAGPPSIGVYPGERITWRVYNNCKKEALVEMTDLRRSPSDRQGFTYAKTWDEINELKRKRQDDKTYVPLDPFEPGDKSKKVAGRDTDKARRPVIDEMSLKVKDNAQAGLYTYVVKVNGVADEGDIPIWP
ncbi:MAG: hypothetical protein DMF81_12095 [Acidobacteria bacterium]|nr:MAG: hypothetical protein DMF81_12095 [Acidobacteriota bacterium]